MPRWNLLVLLRSAIVPLVPTTVWGISGTLSRLPHDTFLGDPLDESTGRMQCWKDVEGELSRKQLELAYQEMDGLEIQAANN